jgi:DNA-directed RNA polymerase subunit M/transcription elongation factor TFIIS
MKTINNPVKFRSKIVDYLYQEIKDIPDKNTKVMSRNIEKSIYNYSLDSANEYKIIKRWDNKFFVQIYLDKFKMLYFILRQDAIQKKIMDGTIQSRKIAYMTHQEINPEGWADMLEDRKIRLENKYFPKIEASSDQFTCRKCKTNKCTYYELQTRSGDESTTIFVTCLTCGAHWRQ